MAKVTSSSTRSKRSSTKPVTKGQNPQRANRQAVSQAKVSSAANRAVTGSAKVTTGTGGVSTPPSGRQPRAITNGNSPAMRQIRAKAVQARRQAQGKSTVASRNTTVTPTNARGERIRSMAKAQRTIGDSGQVRAAQARGQAEAAKAQARRGARAATKAMSRTLAAARTARNIAGAAKMAGPAGVVAAVLAPRKLADGTLKGKPTGNPQGPNVPKRLTQAGLDKGSFGAAFKASRSAGKKEFTWRGKRYNTKIKGEK